MRKRARLVRATDLTEFHTRYNAVLNAVALYVHAKAERGARWIPTDEVARWIAHDLPTLYRETFGKHPKPLRVWRVRTMLSNANYLGAYVELDIKSVRGKGLGIVSEPRRGSGRHLRVIRGGKT